MAPKRTHIKDMLSELNFLSMEERRYFHLATLVFKCVANLAPVYLCSLLEAVDDIHGRVTRASTKGDLVVRKSRIKAGDRAFQHGILCCWMLEIARVYIHLNQVT